MPATINASQMRRINRSAVLELIRRQGPISRTEIGRALGLSLPTVMRIVNNLLAEGIVSDTGEMESSSSGRRPQLLEYNKHNGLVLGIDLGGTKIYGTLANVGGEILVERYMDWRGAGGEDKYRTLLDLIQQLLASRPVTDTPVRGVAVGAPGLTLHQTGVVCWAPALDWRDVPLKEMLEKEIRLPVFVDNDVNLAVLGEHHFGIGQSARNLVLIAIGTGMGAGLIVDGELYHGAHEAAGEVGYLLPEREALGKHYDRFGAMESIVSGSGIAERARRRLAAPASSLDDITAKEVFEAARRQESWALELVEETVDYLTMTIANISTVLDPDLVILGGGVAYSADFLIPPILAKLDGLIPYIPRIEASNLGYRAAVMGGIALIVLKTTGYVGRLETLDEGNPEQRT